MSSLAENLILSVVGFYMKLYLSRSRYSHSIMKKCGFVRVKAMYWIFFVNVKNCVSATKNECVNMWSAIVIGNHIFCHRNENLV